jgi:hypothetical protein
MMSRSIQLCLKNVFFKKTAIVLRPCRKDHHAGPQTAEIGKTMHWPE